MYNPFVETASDTPDGELVSQAQGGGRVLTYLLAQHTATITTFWSATQVYQMRKAGWRVIHTHWSAAQGQQP
jgi:hypothetical protein